MGCSAHHHVALATNSGRWGNTTPSPNPPAPRATPRHGPAQTPCVKTFSVWMCRCRWVRVVGGDEGATQHTWVQGVVTGVLVSHVSQTKTRQTPTKRKWAENRLKTPCAGGVSPLLFLRAVPFTQGLPTADHQVTQAEVVVHNLSGMALQSTQHAKKLH